LIGNKTVRSLHASPAGDFFVGIDFAQSHDLGDMLPGVKAAFF
jgi:hypothetical protein